MYDDIQWDHPEHASRILVKRERVFLILSAIFLASMTLLNVIGLTRFVELMEVPGWGPMVVAVGVLPYPLTFLCTDLISELFGKKRATLVVWVGLFLNLLVLGVLWLGDVLPSADPGSQPPWQTLQLAQAVALPSGETTGLTVELFHLIYACTTGAVFASMAAYASAQFCDVYLFHFWKRVTGGKHLWLRNNGSTLMSQLVDSFMVVTITFGAAFTQGKILFATLVTIFFGNYLFKFLTALLDTGPFYVGVHYLRRYLEMDA